MPTYHRALNPNKPGPRQRPSIPGSKHTDRPPGTSRRQFKNGKKQGPVSGSMRKLAKKGV